MFPSLPLSIHHSIQIQSGIGRMILKEEMKARSGSYDNDPWASGRSSRSGSKETLHSMGYNNTVNGCEGCLLPVNVMPAISTAAAVKLSLIMFIGWQASFL